MDRISDTFVELMNKNVPYAMIKHYVENIVIEDSAICINFGTITKEDYENEILIQEIGQYHNIDNFIRSPHRNIILKRLYSKIYEIHTILQESLIKTCKGISKMFDETNRLCDKQEELMRYFVCILCRLIKFE